MKIKKLLAFLLCLVIMVAGLPSITSSAAEAQTLIGGYLEFNSSNYTKSIIPPAFTLNSNGVLRFQATRLVGARGTEVSLTYNLYEWDGANLGKKIWSVNNYKFNSSDEYYERLIGVPAGTYKLEVYPSIYSSDIPSGGSIRSNLYLQYLPIANYETETNDDKASADSLRWNTPVYGYADHTEDYYSVTVNRDMPARIKIKNYTKLIDAAYIKFISAKNESQFLSSYKAGAGDGYYFFDVLLRAGTNYINVTSVSKAQIDYCIEVSNSVVIPAPVVKNLKISGTRVDVSWSQLSGIDGFEIYRKINKNPWKLELNAGSTTIGFYQTGTNFKNTYQFKVRAYKTIGNTKYYSDWSNIKALNPTPTNIKLSASTYTYNGKVKTPGVTIKDKTGKKLTKGTDYTVSYASGRKSVGKYKVTITFKGNYSGKKTVYFKIVPKGTSVSKVTAAKKSLKVKLKKQTSQTTGYQIQYSTSKKFTSAKTVTVKSSKTTSATIKSLKAKKTYYVRVRTFKTVKGTKYYSSWSSYKSKKTK